MILDEFYLKKVIDLTTAKELGMVEGIYIDKTTFMFAGLAVKSNDFMLNVADIVGKENYITICGVNSLTIPNNCIKICLGQKVLTRLGKELGTVSDIVFGRKYIKLMMGTESIQPYKIVAASQNYLVVNQRIAKPSTISEIADEDFGEESNSSNEEPATNDSLITAPENSQSESNNRFFFTVEDFGNTNTSPPFPKAQIEEFIITATAPLRYASVGQGSAPDYSFLLGRKVEREITDLNRTFHIAVGTIITDQILASAKKAGKIVDLAINSSKT